MSIDTAVVLAAGEGQRLRPLTRHRPKPMLPVGGRPILEYVLDAALTVGIDELHLVVGYRRSRVQKHVGADYRGVDVTYHVQEKRLGSGHALLQAIDAVDGPCLVLNGDQLVEASIVSDVAAAHEAGDRRASLGIAESDVASRYGSVTVADGRVADLIERPGADGEYGLLNVGVYAFDAAAFGAIAATPRDEGTISLPAAVRHLLDSDIAVAAVRTTDYWSDATYPWDLPAVTRTVLAGGLAGVDEDRDPVDVSPSATVADDATLRPPVVVAPDATVGPGAVIGPNVAVGRNAAVESNAVVRDSVVDDDVRIGATSVVVDSVLGQAASLGPGCALPGGQAAVRIDDAVYRDRRLGAVLADRAALAGGVTCRPGVLVGPSASVAVGVTLSENVDAEAEVRR